MRYFAEQQAIGRSLFHQFCSTRDTEFAEEVKSPIRRAGDGNKYQQMWREAMLWGLVTWLSQFGNEELPQNVNHEVNTTLHYL